MIKRALISVSDKTGIAIGGSAASLGSKSFDGRHRGAVERKRNQGDPISDVTGFPMFGRACENAASRGSCGTAGARDDSEHMKQLEDLQITRLILWS
jgi:AICAR transformylase/IMP cyclohydrolase PurH